MALSLGNNQYDMYSFPQNLISVDVDGGRYYMSGGLYGYQTDKQTSSSESERNRYLDVFLFPLSFSEKASNFCFSEKVHDRRDLQPFGDFYNDQGARQLYQLYRDNDRDVPKQRRDQSVFRVNYSKFASSFLLKSFIKTPRPCAYRSLQLVETPEDYYRSSEALIFKISEQTPYGSIITQMNPLAIGGTTMIIDRKGEISDAAAFTGREGGKIGFF